jgi:nucleoside-diphosphate-sugar epimerase
MSNVVVTGGYGFIGSHLVSALLGRGDCVTVFDLAKNTRDSSMDFDRHANFRFVHGDVTDLTDLESALTPDVDKVFHLSAVVGIKNYVEDPLRVLDVNVTGTRNVLELSRRHGTRVLFASTSEVFGKNPNPPFAEDDDRVLGSTRTARWSYSTSKAMAEHLVFAVHTTYGLPVTVVRYFNVYGPRQNPIFGSMTETKIRDVVELAIKLAGVDSVASAEAIDTEAHYGARYEDIPRRIPDSTKAQRELGWRLEVDVDEGIRRTIDWARANPWYLAEPVGVQA